MCPTLPGAGPRLRLLVAVAQSPGWTHGGAVSCRAHSSFIVPLACPWVLVTSKLSRPPHWSRMSHLAPPFSTELPPAPGPWHLHPLHLEEARLSQWPGLCIRQLRGQPCRWSQRCVHHVGGQRPDTPISVPLPRSPGSQLHLEWEKITTKRC